MRIHILFAIILYTFCVVAITATLTGCSRLGIIPPQQEKPNDA